MRTIYQSLGLLALCASVTCAASGQLSVSVQQRRPDKPIVGVPYEADQSLRTQQHLGNGTTLTREIKGHIYRSADGLERIEAAVVENDPAKPTPPTISMIVDRAKHTVTTLRPDQKNALVMHLPENATANVSLHNDPPATPGTPPPPQPVDLTTTDLGHRMQGMMRLDGKRVIGTIPAGKIGNDQPITVTTEIWGSTDMKIIVSEVEKNPLTRDREMQLTNIRFEEPDANLFKIPDDYKIIDPPARGTVSLGAKAPAHLPDSDPEAKDIETALNSSDPEAKFLLAHTLAIENTHITYAKTIAEQAVKLEEQQTANLDPKAPDAWRQMMTLARHWDLLAYILFREGKTKEAEPYEHAAWQIDPASYSSVHLGRIYEREARNQEAIEIYRMALSLPIDPTQRTQIQDRLTALGQPNADLLPSSITTPLPHVPAGPGNGEIMVDILLSHEGPATITFLSGPAAVQQPVTKAIQTALADTLPDNGPEKVLHRARVVCTDTSDTGCKLRFIGVRTLLPPRQDKQSGANPTSLLP